MDKFVRSLVAQNTLIVARLNALEGLFARGGIDIGTVADPAPDGGGFSGGGIGGFIGGIGPIADPAPFELDRLSKVQLESRIADVAFARKKLDSMEGILKEALDRAR
ncbi:hypothetical protein K3729_13500 [Rhodobacteraceae bacterium S2214]|nr:hypothetical protein K3729_13500 [Rhodobacteraceae bacterium S2214]